MGKCYSKRKKEPVLSSASESLQIDNPEYRTLTFVNDLKGNNLLQDQIKAFLTNNHLFRGLEKDELDIMLSKLKLCVAEKDSVIFEQGSIGSLFFIINSGTVEVIVNGKKKSELKRGECFGEMALLSDSIRKATIKTNSKCSFWILSRKIFFKTLKSMYCKSFDKIRLMISKVWCFSKFSDSHIDAIARLANYHYFKDTETIIQEDEGGSSIFVMISGTVVFTKNNCEFLRISEPGEIFGEGALLSNTNRLSTVLSCGNTQLISIDKVHLERVFGKEYTNILLRSIAKHAILSDQFLEFLNSNDVDKIVSNLEWKTFANTEIVIKENDPAEKLRVVCTGAINSQEEHSTKIPSYQVIGLRNLNEKQLKKINYLSEGTTIVGEILNSRIEELIKVQLNNLFQELNNIKLISQVRIFKGFSLKTYKHIAKNLFCKTYQKDFQLFAKGDSAEYLYIIKQGSVKIFQNNKILRVLKENDTFGERSLNELYRSASAMTLEKSELYLIESEMLRKIKEIKLLNLEIERKKYYQTDVSLRDFKVEYEYPNSGIRRHYCVKNKFNNIFYDLIVVSRNNIVTKSDFTNLVVEKEILLQLDYNLVTKLVSTDLDPEFVYFFTEHVYGAPLRSFLGESEEFNKMIFVFITSTIEYLHAKDIIHRDICTDNFWVSEQGHPYLNDFRYAKIEKSRTYTRVGNPYYRPPETILGRGYTKSTDFWSLGVVLYEMVYGYLPFTIKDIDQPIIAYEKILHVKHGIQAIKGDHVNNLILGLLSDAKTRFDMNLIKNSKWLKSFDWENLFDLQVPIENPEIFEQFQNKLKSSRISISEFKPVIPN